jgi:PmbA/TldA metallopeptidase domain 1
MLAHPERFFADRFGLSASVMERLLGSTLARRVDHADLYLEYRISEELVLEEGAVKKASRHVSQGAGLRAQSGGRAMPTPMIWPYPIWRRPRGRPEPSPTAPASRRWCP